MIAVERSAPSLATVPAPNTLLPHTAGKSAASFLCPLLYLYHLQMTCCSIYSTYMYIVHGLLFFFYANIPVSCASVVTFTKYPIPCTCHINSRFDPPKPSDLLHLSRKTTFCFKKCTDTRCNEPNSGDRRSTAHCRRKWNSVRACAVESRRCGRTPRRTPLLTPTVRTP